MHPLTRILFPLRLHKAPFARTVGPRYTSTGLPSHWNPHSDFWFLTSDFHIPKGYQGRSPCLVRYAPFNENFVPVATPQSAVCADRRPSLHVHRFAVPLESAF